MGICFARNTPPIGLCINITVPASANCTATIEANQIDTGSRDPDGTIMNEVLDTTDLDSYR